MRKSILIAAITAAMSLAVSCPPAQAQAMRAVLDFRTGDAIRNRCLAYAAQAGHAVAVAVFDQGGNLVSFGNGEASPAAGAVAQWKGRSAAVYQNPTAETAKWNVPTAPMIATAEGGVPLFARDGTPVGGVGVSGAPPAFDAECGSRAAREAGLAVAPPAS